MHRRAHTALRNGVITVSVHSNILRRHSFVGRGVTSVDWNYHLNCQDPTVRYFITGDSYTGINVPRPGKHRFHYPGTVTTWDDPSTNEEDHLYARPHRSIILTFILIRPLGNSRPIKGKWTLLPPVTPPYIYIETYPTLK